ncbi:hypothetical protein EBQ26_10440 [Allofranklinella schreckenbergeri]|uniref:2/3 transmembrane domain holin n=1 Tax=Allofranklinella schreckenbergeri TaxID=1076744 RepID=A0A3M6PYD7_9BURK|nr:putative holin [Allofranklinella schreckenbergeri]RMW96017.1 hypothetical protein EBQ26_10440 [Allofranklinella schreckenbergeri]
MPDTRTPETLSTDAYTFGRLPRLTSWWAIAAVLSALVLLIAPGQLPVTLYKLNLIALAAVAGYWIDRAIFPYARPQLDALRDLYPPDHSRLYFLAAVMLRRALIVAATVLAVALGA